MLCMHSPMSVTLVDLRLNGGQLASGNVRVQDSSKAKPLVRVYC